MSQRFRFLKVLVVAGLVGMFAGTALAVNIELVTVGNPGNAGELSGYGAGGYGPDCICGAVGYTYRMGKFEVMAGQYTEFLNAVAKTDTYGLYNTSMPVAPPFMARGCNIQRSGSSGSYTYSVPADWANRPVNYVSWGDAARFANWLTNGQPTGTLTGNPDQDGWLTEDGSYYLNGATTNVALLAVTRKANARYVIPTEDEWYKAAYHKNDGVTGNYFDYPTSSDSSPTDESPPGGTNSANFNRAVDHTTDAGAYTGSDSPYDTFDQGGNVWEWNETIVYQGKPYSVRGLRGGSFYDHDFYMHAADRDDGDYPTVELEDIGFRVSEVPEPATLGLMALGGLAVLRRKRA